MLTPPFSIFNFQFSIPMNRALLVGINEYPDPENHLSGCVNDVQDMAQFLVEKCGFKKADIRLLVDKRATTAGIRERLGWLLNGLRSGDRVVFHFSGHGAQMPTRNASGEVDRLDEVICPWDFDWTDPHVIRDKEFARLFAEVPEGVSFVWVSDSCHSGNLTRALRKPNDPKEKNFFVPADIAWRIQTALEKGIQPAGLGKDTLKNVALIPGCKDNQTSADAFFGGRPNGALTYFLLQELGSPNGLRNSLKDGVGNVAKALKKAHFTQIPIPEGSSRLIAKAFLG